MKLFYFTATGNSLAVAKEMGGELYSIPQVLKRSKLAFADEKVGIIFPCYYFSLPQPVKEFIKEVKLESDYTFAIMTYGNLSFKAVDRLARLAKKSGLKLDYTNQLLMVDNYLPLYDIETELEKEASKEIESNLKQIKADIEQKERSLLKQSWWERIITSLTAKFYQFKRGAVDKNFSVAESCTSCKICAQVCPVDNIKVLEKPEYQHHCEECLACIHLCPEDAIKLSKAKGDKHFKNKKVDLKEIVESNR